HVKQFIRLELCNLVNFLPICGVKCNLMLFFQDNVTKPLALIKAYNYAYCRGFMSYAAFSKGQPRGRSSACRRQFSIVINLKKLRMSG
ncbi:hypothetical protein XENOCAPTIV_004082, partial [Xenoophorus captivus]